MTVLEDLERKEKEIKDALELADSLDERKSLRSQLREIRKQLFDAPIKIIPEPQKVVSKIQSNEPELKKKDIIEISDENNNMKSVTAQTRMDRTARRTRRAEHMKNLANESLSTNIKDENNNKEKAEISPKKEEVKPIVKTSSFENRRSFGITMSTTPLETKKVEDKAEPKKSFEIKTNGSVDVVLPKKKEFTPNETGLRRTATWSTNRGNNNAFAANKAKFGAQAGNSPLSFGVSYVQNKEEDKVATKSQGSPFNRPLSVNKYTPTVSYTPPNSAPTVASTENKFQIERLNIKKEDSKNIANTSQATNDKVSQITLNKRTDNKTDFETNNSNQPRKFRPSSELIQSNRYSSPPSSPASIELVKTSTEIQNKQNNIETKPLRTFSGNNLNRIQSVKTTDHILDKNKTESPFRRTFSERRPRNRAGINEMNSINSKRNTITLNANIISRSIIAHAQEHDQPTIERPKSMLSDRNTNNLEAGAPSSGRLTPSGRSPTNRPRSWVNERSPTPTRTGTNRPGSFRPEPEAPSFNSSTNKPMSASDRMAVFREAEEKLKRDEENRKAKEAERKRLAEEAAAREKAAAEERRKAEEKRKKEEEERKKAEAEKAKEGKPEMKDSEKMKHAAPCMKKREKKKVTRRTMSISSIVLDWVQEMIKDYPVEVTNFSSSWNNGMAFCALIHHFNPDEFDFSELKPENKRYNFDLAFNTGAKVKNIPILLDTDDMVKMAKPEPRSVQTYIQWIWSVYGPTSGYGPTHQEIINAQQS